MVEADPVPSKAHDLPAAPVLPPLRPGGERFEAVDRLMAMATEKRADRPPAGTSAGVVLPPEPVTSPPAVAVVPPPLGRSGGQMAVETAGRVLSKLRPMLPALVSALRLVDHGAVQAAARLLPLLAGTGTQPAAAESSALAALEAGLGARLEEQRQETRKLRTELARTEEQLTELRWKCAQLDSEHARQAKNVSELAGRVRLLTYAIILLLPLVVALIVLLVLHLRT